MGSLTLSTGIDSLILSTGKDSLTLSTGMNSVTLSPGMNSFTLSTGKDSLTFSTGMDSLSVEMEIKPKVQNDEWYFLQILPQVVWKKVLAKIEDPVDFVRSINASQYFRKHLLSRRTQFLFPKVFRFLSTRYDEDNSKVYDDVMDEATVAAVDKDKVWRYPGGYRLVCRLWNQTVTDYYQGHPSHFRFAMDEIDHKWPRFGRCFGYYNREDISADFLQFFWDTHTSESSMPNRNPLFQRALHVFVNSGDIGGVANAVVENFLEIYGQEVWYLSLNITNTHGTLTEFYFALKYLLEMVPNLKGIRLVYHKGRWQSWRAKSQLRKAVKLNPLKGFPSLKFLEVLLNLPPPILNELLMKNRQVHKLSILAAGQNVFSLHWPNLRELSIEIRSSLEFLQLSLLGKQWKLKAFHGFFSYQGDDETLSQVFRMLEKNWGKSLRNLNICRPSNFLKQKHVFELTLRNKLKLPLLTIFRLTINQSVGLDFLLSSAKNLKFINIQRDTGFKKVNKHKYGNYFALQRVQFLGFETNLETSNIWSKFPNLKKVVSGDVTCYRP